MRILIATLLSIALGSAHAQEDIENSRASAYRVVHKQSASVPDGVVFNGAASTLVGMADDDPSLSISLLQGELGVSKAEVQSLIDILRSTLPLIKEDIRIEMQRIGCDRGAPLVFGDETYATLEAIEDVPEQVAYDHLLRVKNQLNREVADRFQGWLDELKLSTTQIKYDQKKLSDLVGKSGDERLQKVCSDLFSTALPSEQS